MIALMLSKGEFQSRDYKYTQILRCKHLYEYHYLAYTYITHTIQQQLLNEEKNILKIVEDKSKTRASNSFLHFGTKRRAS
jgi:hypothetical protein